MQHTKPNTYTDTIREIYGRSDFPLSQIGLIKKINASTKRSYKLFDCLLQIRTPEPRVFGGNVDKNNEK